MTSLTSAPSRRRNRGFTLTEVLVAIAVIALLAGILLPVVLKAQANARRTRAAADLQAIATGLEAYKTDFGDYPQVPPPAAGAPKGWQVLCWTLLAPYDAAAPAGRYVDGADGFAFRVRAGGKIYQPYLVVDKFKMTGDPKLTNEVGIADLWHDRDNGQQRPILYWPARPSSNIHNTFKDSSGTDQPGFVGPFKQSTFDSTDNGAQVNQALLRVALGDVDDNGLITSEEKAASTGPYLLWSAGPDRIYGPVVGQAVTAETWAECDDVTNFR